MLPLLVTSLALAAAPQVVAPGLQASGLAGGGAHQVERALERTLWRAGAEVRPPSALSAEQRAALSACAASAAACSLRDGPAALLVGTLARTAEGGVALEAVLRSPADGRVLERLSLQAPGVLELTLLLEDSTLPPRLAQVLGVEPSPRLVGRDVRWVYPGVAGVAALAGGALLWTKGQGDARTLRTYRGGDPREAFELHRDAGRRSTAGAVLMGGGAALAGASALLWWVLPPAQPAGGVDVGLVPGLGTLGVSGRF